MAHDHARRLIEEALQAEPLDKGGAIRGWWRGTHGDGGRQTHRVANGADGAHHGRAADRAHGQRAAQHARQQRAPAGVGAAAADQADRRDRHALADQRLETVTHREGRARQRGRVDVARGAPPIRGIRRRCIGGLPIEGTEWEGPALDVDVLVALFDPAHLHHEAAHGWLEANAASGWATSPITENGFARVVSHPDYPGRRVAVADALDRLCAFTDAGNHHFWPDSTSLRRRSRIDTEMLEGHERIRGAYLLLLSVENEGRLATFDAGCPLDAVPQATPEQLVVLGR